MEVFLRNLPAHLTDQGLQTQLAIFTKALNIDDWSCQKPRKKTFGNITFLNLKDGQRFLHCYERQSTFQRPRSGTGLVILGNEVYCQRSTRAPDPFLLKSLTKSAADKHQADQHSHQAQDAKVVFLVRSLSCGYYEYTSCELVYSPEIEWETVEGLAKFAKRMLIIEFDSKGGRKRVEIPYRIVEAMFISTLPTTLTLTLWEAPRFFHVQNPDIIELMATLSFQQKPLTLMSRLTELPDGNFIHREVLGQSMVYRISVSPVRFDELSRKLDERSILAIYRHNVPASPLHQRKSLGIGLKELSGSIREYSRIIPFSVLYQMEALVRNGYLLPWTVQALLTKMAKLPEDAGAKPGAKDFPISSEAVKKLFSQIPFPSLETDASVFEPDEIWQYIKHNEEEFRHSLTQELISERRRQNLTMIHKVNVTPTGIALHGPDPEAKNRILRRFPDHSEFFIRVQFCDEDGTDLHFNSNVSNEEIYQSFKNVFKHGIAIGGRVFGFLGFSHSSLRSHAAWFMAPFFHEEKLQTYFSVISHLGNFDNICCPARCAARIGQAFSETPRAISLSANRIEHDVIPDVKSKDGSRIFSDGVGIISRSVMEAIHATVSQHKGIPTCFQVRWGGAKGMLGLDTRLEGSTMYVRPSMVKFQSTDNANLEICDTANKPIPMVLNRQMIKILEDMGVSEDWFFRQQARALNNLRLVTAHVLNTVGFLKRHSVADIVGFPQLIRRFDLMGIDYRRDRFLSSVVEVVVLRELRLLKHKARIPVKQGVTLFGIMDETGYLNEGEVYVTFDDAVFVQDCSIDLDNRRVIITRSPALHPGDIQLATNIVPPSHHPLCALRNCIVFSQRGKRDLPSCLSGGDLDGDTYVIIWDQDAVRECRRIFEPADYPRVEPLNIGRVVEREDMTNFFIDFMATDQLGLIATRHMILADQRDTGTLDPGISRLFTMRENAFTLPEDCKLLAEMHSTGVDYSKTGIAVDMNLVKKIKMSKYRPDLSVPNPILCLERLCSRQAISGANAKIFSLAPAPPANIKGRTEICFESSIDPSPHENDDEDDNTGPKHQYYYSEKINGKLYRAIDETRIWYQDIRISVNPDVDVWVELLQNINLECREQLGEISCTKAEQEAWEIRSAYEDAIWNAALEYSDHATHRITELEVFTGAIFNKSGVQTRRQRDKSVQLKDEFDRIAQWAETMIRKRKRGTPSNRTEGEQLTAGSDDALMLSIACVKVGCIKQRVKQFGSGRAEENLQSFKVIAACCAIKELDVAMNRRQRLAGSTSWIGIHYS